MRTLYAPSGRAGEYAELAVNLYSGCPHGCRYCYVPSIVRKDREVFRSEVVPRAGLLEALEGELRKKGPGSGKARPPVHLCFLCDPFPVGFDHSLTVGAVELLHRYGYPVQFLTKNGEGAMTALRLLSLPDPDPALPPLLHAGDRFGISLITTESHREEWEPGAGSIGKRIVALIKASFIPGVETWASFEPIINPSWSFSVLGRLIGYVDEIRLGTWNHDDRGKTVEYVAFVEEVLGLLEKTDPTARPRVLLKSELFALLPHELRKRALAARGWR